MRRAAWLVYACALAGLGGAHMVVKVSSDAGGPASRYGPLIVGLASGAGAVAHALGRAGKARWPWALLGAIAAAGLLGLLALEVIVLTVASAPARVHAIIIGGALLLTPALAAFAQRTRRARC